jgi:L-cysteine:1D-myo-inositol 2-amino-2-deoxy-alpha-D-glucopyranoside ligase
MNGEKMSKSLGNLVFIDALRREWDPMAIRLGIIEHHYRTEWSWDDGLMARATERLMAWRNAIGGDHEAGHRLLEVVRDRLDDDLDTPGVMRAIDEGARRGVDVRAAADLVGVVL